MSRGGLVGLAVALSLISASAWAKPKDPAGITYGPAGRPGVKVIAQQYDKVAAEDAATSSNQLSSPIVSGLALGPRPNMCTGLVRGTEFVAFNDSPVCASFVAPRPPRAAPAAPAAPAPPSPEDIALVLMDRAVGLAPTPRLRIDPGRIGLTGLDSFFSTRAPRPIQVSASVPGFTVTAEARPVQYVWDFDDGASRTTRSPGRPWTRRRPGSISHLYETRGSYSASVEIIWAARWRLGAGEWRDLGFFSTSDARDYPVRQVVALLVKPR